MHKDSAAFTVMLQRASFLSNAPISTLQSWPGASLCPSYWYSWNQGSVTLLLQSECRWVCKDRNDSTRRAVKTGYSRLQDTTPPNTQIRRKKRMRRLCTCLCFTHKHLMYPFAFRDLFYRYTYDVFSDERFSLSHTSSVFFWLLLGFNLTDCFYVPS